MKYRPHKYQQYAKNFIMEHPVCCLMLDMGLGKTGDHALCIVGTGT